MFVWKQEPSKHKLSVSPTFDDSHGFGLLDAGHLVLLVPARYPLVILVGGSVFLSGFMGP